MKGKGEIDEVIRRAKNLLMKIGDEIKDIPYDRVLKYYEIPLYKDENLKITIRGIFKESGFYVGLWKTGKWVSNGGIPPDFDGWEVGGHSINEEILFRIKNIPPDHYISKDSLEKYMKENVKQLVLKCRVIDEPDKIMRVIE